MSTECNRDRSGLDLLATWWVWDLPVNLLFSCEEAWQRSVQNAQHPLHEPRLCSSRTKPHAPKAPSCVLPRKADRSRPEGARLLRHNLVERACDICTQILGERRIALSRALNKSAISRSKTLYIVGICVSEVGFFKQTARSCDQSSTRSRKFAFHSLPTT